MLLIRIGWKSVRPLGFTVYCMERSLQFAVLSRSMTRSAYIALYRCYIFGKCRTKDRKAKAEKPKISKPNAGAKTVGGEELLRNINIAKLGRKDDKRTTLVAATQSTRAHTTLPTTKPQPRRFGLADLIRGKSWKMFFSILSIYLIYYKLNITLTINWFFILICDTISRNISLKMQKWQGRQLGKVTLGLDGEILWCPVWNLRYVSLNFTLEPEAASSVWRIFSCNTKLQRICSSFTKNRAAITKYWLKGTVAWDFRPMVFFMNRPHMGPWFIP